jgi:hypothetical protein
MLGGTSQALLALHKSFTSSYDSDHQYLAFVFVVSNYNKYKVLIAQQ